MLSDVGEVEKRDFPSGSRETTVPLTFGALSVTVAARAGRL
jgi:hypothetical protein